MIKIDMPMPECCASCRFRDPDYGFCHADYDGRVIHNRNIREEWCPLKIAVVPDQSKPKPEPKKISALECYIDVPFPVCAKCPKLSPKLIHDQLFADYEVIDNSLRVVCMNDAICLNLAKIKSEEVNAHDQSVQDADTDQL